MLNAMLVATRPCGCNLAFVSSRFLAALLMLWAASCTTPPTREEVYQYLLRRIERSIPAAREVVRRLDEAADEQQRGISRVLAREILDDGTLELFE